MQQPQSNQTNQTSNAIHLEDTKNSLLPDKHIHYKPRRAIYLLPNAFTMAALFCGLYAIVLSIHNNYQQAAWFIFYAMILDGLDGRVARLTHTQSAFGEQFDSLSDVIAFGVAPSLLVYQYTLNQFGKLGLAVCFIFCAAGAMRLARFNANIGVVTSKSYFQGLPIPAAAANIAIVMLCINAIDALPIVLTEKTKAYALMVLMLYLAFAMVSNLPFYSGKKLSFGHVPFKFLVIVLALFALITIEPMLSLLAICLVYALSGLVWGMYCKLSGKGNPVFRKDLI